MPRPLSTLVFALAASVPGFSGCEKRLAAENVEVLNRQQELAQNRVRSVEGVDEGLTMKEVEAVLGAPARVQHGKVQREVLKDFAFTTWTYVQDGQEMELSFVDGKLQGRVSAFGQAPNARAPFIMKKEAAK